MGTNRTGGERERLEKGGLQTDKGSHLEPIVAGRDLHLTAEGPWAGTQVGWCGGEKWKATKDHPEDKVHSERDAGQSGVMSVLCQKRGDFFFCFAFL